MIFGIFGVFRMLRWLRPNAGAAQARAEAYAKAVEQEAKDRRRAQKYVAAHPGGYIAVAVIFVLTALLIVGLIVGIHAWEAHRACENLMFGCP